VAFVTCDRKQEEFDEYYKTMPWLTIEYKSTDERKFLKDKYKNTGIPQVILIKDNGDAVHTTAVEDLWGKKPADYEAIISSWEGKY